MIIDKYYIDVFEFSDGKLNLSLSSKQQINIIPGNVSLYDFKKGARKFSWLFSLSNMKVGYEVIKGSADLVFLMPPSQKIKIIYLNNTDILLNDINQLLLWTNGIKIDTHLNMDVFSHDSFITKIHGTGVVVFKYSSTLHEIEIDPSDDRKIYIQPSLLFLFEKDITFKKVTVGKGVSSYWQESLLRADGTGKFYISSSPYSENNMFISQSGSILEDMPVIGQPISILNKLIKK